MSASWGFKVVFFAGTADEANPAVKVEAQHDLDGPRGERSQDPRKKKTTALEGDDGGGDGVPSQAQ